MFEKVGRQVEGFKGLLEDKNGFEGSCLGGA